MLESTYLVLGCTQNKRNVCPLHLLAWSARGSGSICCEISLGLGVPLEIHFFVSLNDLPRPGTNFQFNPRAQSSRWSSAAPWWEDWSFFSGAHRHCIQDARSLTSAVKTSRTRTVTLLCEVERSWAVRKRGATVMLEFITDRVWIANEVVGSVLRVFEGIFELVFPFAFSRGSLDAPRALGRPRIRRTS